MSAAAEEAASSSVLKPPAQLIVHIIRAFCLAISPLNLFDFHEIMADILSTPLARERRAILAQAFCTEALADMFLRSYCTTLTGGINCAPTTRYSGLDTPRIARFFYLVVSDAPEQLIRVLSTPSILEKLILWTLQACQYARCSGRPQGSRDFLDPFLFTAHAIT